MADTTPASQATERPRTRQRTYKAPPALEVPDIDEDAPERKRVLNVLAQRRYREKKRQNRLRENKEREKENEQTDRGDVDSSADEPPGELDVIEVVPSPTTQASPPGGSSTVGLNLSSWELVNDASLSSLLPATGQLPDLLAGSNPGEESLSFSNSGGGLTDMLSVNFGSPSTLENVSNSPSDVGFPDSYLLPVNELTLIRAMLRIAERIGCKDELWSLAALSPFNQGVATPAEQLPIAWQPTSSQLLVPHHPILDFLPWPGVRDRVLNIFSLPDKMRPPNAAGPLALVNFAYDFEDNAEGVRIYGSDPFDPRSWEVGQVFFERWWFLFDRDIIANSNRWRRLRGAPPLAIKGTQ